MAAWRRAKEAFEKDKEPEKAGKVDGENKSENRSPKSEIRNPNDRIAKQRMIQTFGIF